jgi:archaellum component FlaC
MNAVTVLGNSLKLATVSLLLVLTGCQTTGSSSAAPADPRLVNSNSAQFFSKSGWQACAGGALVGALACQLGNPSEKTQCMVAAGLVGCGVGMGANYYLDNQRSKYANAEDRLDATIADVRKDNQELTALSDTARSVIADDKRKIQQIKQDIASNKLQRAQAQQQIADIDANTNYLKKTLADVRSKQQEWVKVAAAERNSGARTDTLDAEINKMQKQVAQLETEIDQLYQQRSSIQLG